MDGDTSGLSDLDGGQLRAVLRVLGRDISQDVEEPGGDGEEKLLRARLCRMLLCVAERHTVVTEIVAEPGATEQMEEVDRHNIIESLRDGRVQDTMMLVNWRARRLAVTVTELAELFNRGRRPDVPELETRGDEQQLWALIDNAAHAVADALPVLVSLMADHDTVHSRAEDLDSITRRMVDAADAAIDLRARCGLNAPEKARNPRS